MIQVKQISKKYGSAEVLNIDTLDIPTGQSVGLVGNNGAGKTTLFNLLLDLIRPTTGKITNNNVQVNEPSGFGSAISMKFLRGQICRAFFSSRCEPSGAAGMLSSM